MRQITMYASDQERLRVVDRLLEFVSEQLEGVNDSATKGTGLGELIEDLEKIRDRLRRIIHTAVVSEVAPDI